MMGECELDISDSSEPSNESSVPIKWRNFWTNQGTFSLSRRFCYKELVKSVYNEIQGLGKYISVLTT